MLFLNSSLNLPSYHHHIFITNDHFSITLLHQEKKLVVEQVPPCSLTTMSPLSKTYKTSTQQTKHDYTKETSYRTKNDLSKIK
jgi:hypothetical protein